MSGPLSAGRLAPAALAELHRWQQVAADWPVYQDGACLRCRRCAQCVLRTEDYGGTHYVYSDEQRLALTVAHLRLSHPGAAEVTPQG